MSPAAPRLLGGSFAVAVVASLSGYMVSAATLPYGVPPEAVGVLTLVVTILVCGLGCALVARRWPAEGPVDVAAGAAVPVLLGVWVLVASQTPWWFRLVVLAAFGAAGLLGTRAGSRDAGAPPPVRAGERGSGSLEFVGVVILAAVLVAAAVGATASSSPGMRDTIWAKICQITGGACSPGQAPTNVEYKPDDCETRTAETKINATVDVAFVRLGSGAIVQRVEKSDGTVEITVLEEGRGGAVAAAGAHGGVNVGDKGFGFDWEAEAAATVGLQAGETYVFDDAADADAFQSYMQGEVIEDAVTSTNPVIKAVNWGVEKVTGEEPPENDGVQKQFVRFDEQVTASANAEFGYGASAGASAEVMVALGLENDRGDKDDASDNRQTVFFQVDWAAAANVGLPAVKGMDAGHAASGVVKVTLDAEGKISEVSVVDRSEGSFEFGLAADEDSVTPVGSDPKGTLERWDLDFKAGPSSSVVVTQTLQVDSPEKEQAVLDWLGAAGGSNALATAGLSTVPLVDSEDGDNVTSIGGGEGFADLMAEEAKVSIVEYDGDTWGFGGGLGLSLAVKASADLSYDDKEASAVKAAYLGAPDAEGSRTAYDLPECVA